MMTKYRVRVATPVDLDAWQAFVDQTKNAGGLHHAGWFNVLRQAFWVTPYYLIATDARDSIQAVLPAYHSKSLLTGSHLSSLEGGILTRDPEATVAVLSAAKDLRKQLRASYLQIRGGPLDDRVSASVVNVKTIVETNQSSEAIWVAMTQSARRAVRKSENQEVEIERDVNFNGLESYYGVYAARMRDLGTPVIGLDAFQAILQHVGRERLRLYLAWYRGRVIGGMLCIVNVDRWTSYFSAVRVSNETAFANYKLYWQVLRDACAQRISHFDLGRSTPGSNVHIFKQRWGGCDAFDTYGFYADPTVHVRKYGLEEMKKKQGLSRRVWKRFPLPLCNRLGPLLRKQLPFI